VHVAVDDYSRLAYVEVLGDERAMTAAGFLRRALAFYARYGIRVERVLTDNGSAYRSTVHALACRALGIRHLRTRPHRPQTNGKAERFIGTLLSGSAYGRIYRSSSERTTALDGWLWHYNHRRRHSALSHQPPASRTNLHGSYSSRRVLSSQVSTAWSACRRNANEVRSRRNAGSANIERHPCYALRLLQPAGRRFGRAGGSVGRVPCEQIRVEPLQVGRG
jgi:hypothetical protein